MIKTRDAKVLFNESKILCLFFIMLLFEFSGFYTVSLLITQNIRNAPLTLKIINQCFFIPFKYANSILFL